MPTIDISMPLFVGMPAFPGDPPFASRSVGRIEHGDPYALSTLTLGSHAGTHIDPPLHFFPGGLSVDRLDLEVLNGACWVVDVRPDRRTVRAEELGTLPPRTDRVLLRTANSARWARKLEYFDDFVGLSLEGARYLASRGVRLVGIDALSVEVTRTGRFPVHRTLLGQGVVILEGLLLEKAAGGKYELGCLPLAVRGGDGAPARAILRSP